MHAKIAYLYFKNYNSLQPASISGVKEKKRTELKAKTIFPEKVWILWPPFWTWYWAEVVNFYYAQCSETFRLLWHHYIILSDYFAIQISNPNGKRVISCCSYRIGCISIHYNKSNRTFLMQRNPNQITIQYSTAHGCYKKTEKMKTFLLKY